ncbi:MAG: APC family permease [Saprospiraceae bacterium]
MTELRKEISLFGLTMIAIGASIGVGIFLTPGNIAAHVQSPAVTLWVWALGGLITLTGALTFAELGAMFPNAGGIYVYLKVAYGDMIAFLYGWVTLLVVNTGSLAFLALAFAKYFNFVIDVGYDGMQYVAIGMILFVTLVNVFAVSIGEIVSSILTGLKILGIGVLIVSGLILIFHNPFPKAAVTPSLIDEGGNQFALALIGVLFSYGGWQHATYLAGEVKNGKDNIPKALVYGATAITLIYLLCNLSYIYLMPFEQLQTSNTLAADALQRIFPVWGGVFIAVVIMISAMGTSAIYMFGVPRIYYAMSKDGVFFPQLARLHPRFQTPVNAILLQSAWAILLIVFWGRLENIINYVVFTDWIFFLLAALSVFILRYKLPHKNRPYKVWGYPIVPFVFVAIVSWFIFNLLFTKDDAREQVYAGIFVLILGVFFYYFFKKYRNIER